MPVLILQCLFCSKNDNTTTTTKTTDTNLLAVLLFLPAAALATHTITQMHFWWWCCVGAKYKGIINTTIKVIYIDMFVTIFVYNAYIWVKKNERNWK